MSINAGGLYLYEKMSVTVWSSVEKPDIEAEIPKNTPFVVLGLVIPKGFTTEVLKILTIDGLIGYASYFPNLLKEVDKPYS